MARPRLVLTRWRRLGAARQMLPRPRHSTCDARSRQAEDAGGLPIGKALHDHKKQGLSIFERKLRHRSWQSRRARPRQAGVAGRCGAARSVPGRERCVKPDLRILKRAKLPLAPGPIDDRPHHLVRSGCRIWAIPADQGPRIAAKGRDMALDCSCRMSIFPHIRARF